MKGLKRKIFPLVVLLLCSSSSFSQDSSSATEYNFVVWLHDGGRVSFPLVEHPVVTHRDGMLVVSSHDAAVEYAHSAVRKFTLEEAVVQPEPTPEPEPAVELYFVAWFHSGARIAFPFSERPRLTYADGDLVITTSEEELRYAHSSVRKFTIEAEDISQGGTTEIAATERESRWQQQGDAMVFTDCTPGECVSIFDASGRLVQQHVIASDGTLQIPLSSFAEGMYIVKTESITYKFMKR